MSQLTGLVNADFCVAVQTGFPLTEEDSEWVADPPRKDMDSTMSTHAVDKSSDRVRDMFAQIAGKYDLMNHLLSLNVDKYWRSATVKRVLVEGTAPILDLCTGTGDLAFAFRKVHSNVPIVGADFCNEMLDVARKKQQQRGISDIKFIEASAMQLPFETEQFQVVSVAFGIRNVEDTDQGLSEIVRVCQQGGRVAILEFSKPSVWPLSSIYQSYFRYVLPRVGQIMAKNDKSAYEYLPSSVSQFPSGQEFAKRMATAGLQNIKMFPMTLGVATLYLGVK